MASLILALDIAGNPFDWIPPQEAVLYYATGKVAWELGEREMIFRGGFSRLGIQSRITVKPIIAVAGSEIMARMLRKELPLGHRNHLLFKRDRYTCAYCGDCLTHKELSRDHILPQSRGGKDSWMNCVTACRLSLPNRLLDRRVTNGKYYPATLWSCPNTSTCYKFASPVPAGGRL